MKELKSFLRFAIGLSISVLLLPTIAELISKNSEQRDNIFGFLSNASFLIQTICIIVTSLSGSIYVLIIYKEKKSEKILAEAASKDAIWNEESLKYQARFIFYKIQIALQNNETKPLENYVTSEFLSWFTQVIANDKKDSSPAIDVTETHIICCRDYQDNDKDKFIGYIQGNILNNNSEDAPAKEFSEVYYFIRSKNDWLLYKIRGRNIWNLVFDSNKVET